jgi:RNA polymerase primary sigma factor
MTTLLERTPHQRSSPLTSYLREINETGLLTEDEEHNLAERVRNGDAEARDQMVRANLRLVVHVARQFTGRGVCLEDLIQEGNLGLLCAVERFDPEQGTRFSTYAAYWIKQAIMRGLDNTATSIRVPSYAVDLVANWRRTAVRLQDQLGRAPTSEEIAGELGLSKKRLQILTKALRVYNGVRQSESADDSWPQLDLSDAEDRAPGYAMETAEEVTQVLNLLNTLHPRVAMVLRLRFGLSGSKPHTLREIGQQLGLTRERVRQLELEALEQLRDRL